MPSTKLILPLVAALISFNSAAASKKAPLRGCDADLASQFTSSEARIANNRFRTGRDFYEYSQALDRPGSTPLLKLIQDLPEGGVWMDFGAGQARAQRSFLELGLAKRRLHLVSASFNREADRPGIEAAERRFAGIFHFVETGMLEDAAQNPAHILHLYRGKVALLTEVVGPVAYTRDLNAVFGLIIDLLKTGGKARIDFGPETTFVQNGRILSPKEAVLAIAKASGGRLTLHEGYAQEYGHYTATFAKTGDLPEAVPGLFVLKEFLDGTPSKRTVEIP